MPKKPVNTCNEVYASGRIIWTGINERGYRAIRMLVGGKNVVEFSVNKLPPSIGIRDFVSVRGYVRAFDYYNEMRNKRSYHQNFVAVSITKENSELSKHFGIEGGTYVGETKFQCFFRGRVAQTIAGQSNWHKLVVEVASVGQDQRPTRVELNYKANGRLPKFNYSRGEEVYVYADVFVQEKQLGGSTVRFENLMVQDVVKAEPPELTENSEALEAAVTAAQPQESMTENLENEPAAPEFS